MGVKLKAKATEAAEQMVLRAVAEAYEALRAAGFGRKEADQDIMTWCSDALFDLDDTPLGGTGTVSPFDKAKARIPQQRSRYL
jgi:hypothetical protein